MDNKTDKYLDDLSKKVIENAPLEKPSFDFTSAVMSKISELNASPITYRPLISKKGWFMVLLFVVALVSLIWYYRGSSDSSSLINHIDFSILSNNQWFESLSNMSVSKTLVYAVAFFGLMLGIQITFLKNHFNKRLS